MQNRFQYDWVKQQAWRQEQRQQRQQHQELKKQEGLERLQRLRTQRRSVHGPEVPPQPLRLHSKYMLGDGDGVGSWALREQIEESPKKEPASGFPMCV
jgi:hypothetical protein